MGDAMVDASSEPLSDQEEDTPETQRDEWTKIRTIRTSPWVSRSSIKGREITATTTLWAHTSSLFALGVILIAIYTACDPFGILEAVMDFHPEGCKGHAYQCLLPVPDVNAWPADPASKLLNTSLAFHIEVPGPESLAWDEQGRIYTGVADGRVIRWKELDGSWETFAVVSPYWKSELCDFKLRGYEYPTLEHVCGRPLGLKFDASGSLYIADAYFGLAIVGREGGRAKVLCDQSNGQVHKFTNDLEIGEDGVVYFTVSSLRHQRKAHELVVKEQDTSGRVLKYEPETGTTTVLLEQFKYPNGVALAKDGSFLLIVSTSANRILKYWLRGSQTGTLEEFAQMPGYGDNIRSTEDGKHFWVALHGRRTTIHYLSSTYKCISRLIHLGQVMSKTFDDFGRGGSKPLVIKYDISGEPVEVLEDRTGMSEVKYLSTAQERHAILWLSSVFLPVVAVYKP